MSNNLDLYEQVRWEELHLFPLHEGEVKTVRIGGIHFTVTKLSHYDAWYSVVAMYKGERYEYPEAQGLQGIVEELLGVTLDDGF